MTTLANINDVSTLAKLHPSVARYVDASVEEIDARIAVVQATQDRAKGALNTSRDVDATLAVSRGRFVNVTGAQLSINATTNVIAAFERLKVLRGL